MKKSVIISLIATVCVFSSCSAELEVYKVTTENQRTIVTDDSLVYAYDQVIRFTDGSTEVNPKSETYKLVRSYTEDQTREEGTRTITYRHREVKVYADGTVISKPVVKTVDAFVVVYSDGTKKFTPLGDVVNERWHKTVEHKDSVDLHWTVEMRDGTKGDYVTRVSKENYANALKNFGAM
jgi:hypothetical protein